MIRLNQYFIKVNQRRTTVAFVQIGIGGQITAHITFNDNWKSVVREPDNRRSTDSRGKALKP